MVFCGCTKSTMGLLGALLKSVQVFQMPCLPNAPVESLLKLPVAEIVPKCIVEISDMENLEVDADQRVSWSEVSKVWRIVRKKCGWP